MVLPRVDWPHCISWQPPAADPQATWSRDSLSWDSLFPGDARLWQLAIKANQGSVFSKHKRFIPFCDSVFPHHYKSWDCDLRCLRPVWLLETNISRHIKNKELCWLILRSEVSGLRPLPSHLLQPHPAEFISLDKVGPYRNNGCLKGNLPRDEEGTEQMPAPQYHRRWWLCECEVSKK